MERRVAVVTGASRGIGFAVARALGKEGARVVLVAKDLGRLEAAADRLSGEGIEPVVRTVDLADRSAVQTAASAIADEFPVIQTLVNNAGISHLTPASEISNELWDRVIDVNLRAAFAFSRDLFTALRASGRGAIVNISSVMGLGTTAGLAAYSASKAGLEHLTRSLAVEFGPEGVRVNAVSPGFIRTDMFDRSHPPARQEALGRAHPLRRVGTAEEVANVVAFLCGERASFVNGAVLPVDGGLTCELAIPTLIED